MILCRGHLAGQYAVRFLSYIITISIITTIIIAIIIMINDDDYSPFTHHPSHSTHSYSTPRNAWHTSCIFAFTSLNIFPNSIFSSFLPNISFLLLYPFNFPHQQIFFWNVRPRKSYRISVPSYFLQKIH